MIVSPSVPEILRGLMHEMGTSLKEDLKDPVKLAQIDTIIAVLGAAATRVDLQSQIVATETAAILSAVGEVLASGTGSPALKQALEAYDESAEELVRYEAASRMLCVLGDLGEDLGSAAYATVRRLMEQRLANEERLIGVGFEAAGR
ncbi:MAG: hypothetical protein AAGA68_07045 [Pseudomonadota bacterium]